MSLKACHRVNFLTSISEFQPTVKLVRNKKPKRVKNKNRKLVQNLNLTLVSHFCACMSTQLSI